VILIPYHLGKRDGLGTFIKRPCRAFLKERIFLQGISIVFLLGLSLLKSKRGCGKKKALTF
jgi:hypothetical protein